MNCFRVTIPKSSKSRKVEVNMVLVIPGIAFFSSPKRLEDCLQSSQGGVILNIIEARIPEGFAPFAMVGIGKAAQELPAQELTLSKIETDYIR